MAIVTDKILSASDIGRHLNGISSITVLKYLRESRHEGGRYSSNPFPEPTGYVGRSPYWTDGQLADIDAWNEARDGQGARVRDIKREMVNRSRQGQL